MKINFEKNAWQENKFVCGIDEAGRGSLAGPLVVAAAITPQNTDYDLLKDSKVLTKKDREKAFIWIKENCIYSIVIVDVATIERKNIYTSTHDAMIRTLIQLYSKIRVKSKIKYIVSDAVKLDRKKTLFTQHSELHSPTHAESISLSVAAASIVAKVRRDEIMKNLQKTFPQFSFEKHNGYGTAQHTKELKSYGATIIHRKSFLSRIISSNQTGNNHGRQKNIFC